MVLCECFGALDSTSDTLNPRIRVGQSVRWLCVMRGVVIGVIDLVITTKLKLVRVVITSGLPRSKVNGTYNSTCIASISEALSVSVNSLSREGAKWDMASSRLGDLCVPIPLCIYI